MSAKATYFPHPGQNFRDRQGKLRGVKAVVCDEATGEITVIYVDGPNEQYGAER